MRASLPCRYAVPCNVGNTKMRYDLVERHYYWFSLVVSNTRSEPVALLVRSAYLRKLPPDDSEEFACAQDTHQRGVDIHQWQMD